MEIIWHGNTCFTLKGKNITAVINPDKQAGNLKGELVLSSLRDDTAEVKDAKNVFVTPGEYEVQGVAITGHRAWKQSKSKEEEAPSDPTIIFCLEMDDVKICHLGDLGHTLTSEMVNQIGDVDVLMIGGNGDNLDNKKADEIIEEIDPRVVIPMGVKNSSKVLEEWGVEASEPQDKFVIKSLSDLPDDKQDYVVLKKA